ncbi:MAG: prephenate dehydratase domain-containing protein [Blastocatellia bacterium]
MTRVAIQGTRGSYSEQAAFQILGNAAAIIECHDFESAFAAVNNGSAELAVLPFENRIVGQIERPTELLKASGLNVFEKLKLKVRHVLAGTPESNIESLETVRSHVEALKQCRRYLSANAHLRQVIGADTASSVRRIVEENISTQSAIGSRRAVELYGAKILAEDIADDRDNWTTFFLIGNRKINS